MKQNSGLSDPRENTLTAWHKIPALLGTSTHRTVAAAQLNAIHVLGDLGFGGMGGI